MVRVEVTPDTVDLVSGAAWAAGAVGIEETGGVVLVTFDRADSAAAFAADTGDHASLGAFDDVDWVASWRPFATAVEIGPLVIAPPWIETEPGPDRTVVIIDPGMTFGHGGHPTTRLILGALTTHPPLGRRVIDVGCGSGVLGIAAAMLGAAHVTAIDTDPNAVAATRANAAANGVDDRLTASLRPAGEVAGGHDLAVVNVTVDQHELLGPSLVPGPHRLIVSGVLDHQVDRTVAAYSATEPRRVDRLDGWVAISLEATAGPERSRR
ncbi:MAG: 50S ribosomal protein L11 methyltransferase [Acidimicrobiia bacterium]|nr:50S ribosomal protein L11 methyltransferase [Acidimicrobiia bacterium]